MKFAETLAYGQVGESSIARWLQRQGCWVLPVYETFLDNYKGPRVLTTLGKLIAPDMLIFKDQTVTWIEAKHKTGFTWHRITQQWVTGIDLPHYLDYCRIASGSSWPVWLLFLHDGGMTKDAPSPSPSGLYGADLEVLQCQEHHRHENGGRAGMVYWATERDGGPLQLLAPFGEVR